MKYYYIAVTIKKKNNKYYSHILKVNQNDNLLSRLKTTGIIHANICRSRKEAAAIVETWNTCHKINGTYLFDNPSF